MEKEIRQIARKVKSSSRHPQEAAKNLHKEIRSRITYEKAEGRQLRKPGETLRIGRGNCYEQTRLYQTIADHIPLTTQRYVNKKGDHTFPGVRSPAGIKIYDTTTNNCGEPYKRSIHKTPKVFDLDEQQKKSYRAVKMLIASALFSVSINLSQEYWLPPVEKALIPVERKIEQILDSIDPEEALNALERKVKKFTRKIERHALNAR